VLNDNTIPESDTFAATFRAAPGLRAPSPPTAGPGEGVNAALYQAPSCPIPGYATLDAGEMSLSGPGGQVNIQPSVKNGETSYQGSLPSGFVQPGAAQISSAGGTGVGSFTATLNVGAGVQITSQFPKGEIPLPADTVVMNWTGGQAGEVATLKVIEHQFGYDNIVFTQTAATNGTAVIPSIPAPPLGTLPDLQYSTDIEVILEVGPNPSKPQTISVPGLTLGAQVSWAYEYRFVGLTCTLSCR